MREREGEREGKREREGRGGRERQTVSEMHSDVLVTRFFWESKLRSILIKGGILV